ncbi:MAG TPA: MBL fold metallo-hydrolase [Actinophytocola sp.]|jgi:hypothetical protein|nr:MBL fold metallo-hydrolase [Actinophytocola sp.]
MSSTITFIGHQSWLVETGDTRILVDPMLTTSFGHSPELRFEIHPARDVGDLPPIDAVVVTNEHLDHFHLPSLRMLPADVPVIMPRMMPQVCVDEVRALGRTVRLVPLNEVERVGDAELYLLPGAEGAPMWENRVASVYVRAAADTGGGVFIQSDTATATPPESIGCTPEIFIATHNGQVPPAGYLGAFDNMLPLGTGEATEGTGLRMLQGVLHEATDHFDSVRYLAFSGGGYVQVPPKHGEFLWADYQALARLANKLTLTIEVLGLTPGQAARVGAGGAEITTVPWISPGAPTHPVVPSDRNDTAEPDLGAEVLPLFDGELTDGDRTLIRAELDAMSPLLMQARLGRHLINENVYLDSPTGPHRYAFHLRGYVPADEEDDGTRVFALNLNNGRFEELETGLRDALFTIPSGVDTNAVDLLAVLRGRIHIWELAVSRLRQWYLCDKLDSPVGFLYGYFSEQVRPGLARELYRQLKAA